VSRSIGQAEYAEASGESAAAYCQRMSWIAEKTAPLAIAAASGE
jgi:hypothetical protein